MYFLGGLQREIGLVFRQAHDRGYDLRLVSSSVGSVRELSDDSGSGARRHGHGGQRGHAGGAPRRRRSWRNSARRVTSPWDTTLYAYAAVQVWAQADFAAGSLDLDAVTAVMHSRQFDTVLGRIGFDEKGDVTGFDPWQWVVWQADDNYVPLEQSVAKG